MPERCLRFFFNDSSRIGKRVRLALLFLALLPVVPLTFFLRAPMVDNIFCDPDVAGVGYSAIDFMNGGNIYEHCVETKPPGSYMLFSFLFRHFGQTMEPVYLFASVYYVWMALILFAFAARYFGTAQGVIAAYLYAATSVASAATGLCPNFETWTLLPLALAWLCIVEGSRKESFAWFLFSGFFLALALLMKQQALFFVACSPIAVFYESPRNVRGRVLLKFVLGALLGALLLIIPVIALFAGRNGLSTMFRALSLKSNIGYMMSEPTLVLVKSLIRNWKEFFQAFDIELVAAVLFLMFGSLFLRMRSAAGVGKPDEAPASILDVSPGGSTLKIWFLSALIAILAGTKFFAHYLVLFIPPIALISGVFLVNLMRADVLSRKLRAFAFLLFWILALESIRPEIRLATQSFNSLLLNAAQTWREENDLYWHESHLLRGAVFNYKTRRLGACLAFHSAPDDPIFVWDYAPGVYFFAGRRAPTRHFMYFGVASSLPSDSGRWHASEDDPDLGENRRELLFDLRRRQPKFFITFNPYRTQTQLLEHWTPAAPLFKELKEFHEENYEPDPTCTTDLFMVDRLKRGIAPEN